MVIGKPEDSTIPFAGDSVEEPFELVLGEVFNRLYAWHLPVLSPTWLF